MLVAGVDEVGRGSVAGPLLVLAAMFRVETWTWQGEAEGQPMSSWAPAIPCPVAGVKDSKAYSSREQRGRVAAALAKEPSLAGTGLGAVTSADINKNNMGWALRVAFERALTSLPERPDLVLVDGEVPVSSWTGPQICAPKADARWWPVSAASVIAKELRDSWMNKLDREFPGYGWADNKGYGTPAHMDAILRMGITPLHRVAFLRSWVTKQEQKRGF